ncbi:uncharacterized protein LOC113338492 [Papaver somniferum]|uniref:uncharacterized protein LOC113338492 n=1 Tax=Papaver somniferum TaxID=3469 RepID=UPI000E70358C|nr:uncharacterized protein LOC113338492 [Papaver somniferum]
MLATSPELVDALTFNSLVDSTVADNLIKDVSIDEIVLALSTIGLSKAPGPDGFSSHFFKVCWAIVGDDFVAAITNFFSKSKMMKEINIYKCITKIISLRMKNVMQNLISENQYSFIVGRSIQDNILVSHEIVRNYHRTSGSPRCSLKIDLKKAYDTVSWQAVLSTKKKMGFPDKFIYWISLCMSTANILKQHIDNGSYGFHPRCSLTKLIHICFVDDVLVFFKGSLSAALYSSSIDSRVLDDIIKCIDCSSSTLPVRYLGIPLLSIRLSYADCLPLIAKVIDSSWCWRRVLEHRSLAHSHIGFILGDGTKTNFLIDSWHPKGKLTDWVDPNILADYFPNSKVKVTDFLTDNKWNLLDPNSESVTKIFSQISDADFDTNGEDIIIWEPNSKGQHSFISWLALHGRLKTRDKLLKWGVSENDKCVLCDNGSESVAHLFHDCHFYALIWEGLLLRIGYVRGATPSWEVEIQWCIAYFSGNDLISSIKKLVFTGFIYQIWRDRNNRIFAKKTCSIHQVSVLIINDIQLKLSTYSRTVIDIPENIRFLMN